ncbi:MAG: hypothetical protein IJ763_01955 [Lachnospiraceae bacterium]|nr:hypothetical protein [Lachnospiraceae bacterium]
MSAAVILLTILGLAFILGSFVLVENKKDKDDESIIKIPDNLSDEQKEKINKLIDDYMNEHIDDKLDDIEKKFSEIVNQKTLALGDYAVSVNEEIERNHSEVMFLYSMLADKQKEIMTTASMVDDYKKEVKQFIEENEFKKEESKEQQLAIELTELEDNDIDMEAEAEEELQSASGNKDIILEMHKSGLSILEIAKNLGLGVGEVKLIVDLYQGE